MPIVQRSLNQTLGTIENKKTPIRTRPFLRWVGGKSRITDKLVELLPTAFKNYHEPFLGGGAVFFRAIPHDTHSYLSDINSNLIGCYTDIRDSYDSVTRELDNLTNEFISFSSQQEKSDFFYQKRREYNDLRTADTSPRRTGLLIFLNKTCFNGMYRENSKGEFNVPFGRVDVDKLYDKASIEAVSKKLRGAEIFNTSFEHILERTKKNDLIYLDPPYVPLNKTSYFTTYHSSGFTLEDHYKLAAVFRELDKRGCFVVLSNSMTSEVWDLYKEYTDYTKIVEVNRTINCKGDLRSPVDELIIKNF